MTRQLNNFYIISGILTLSYNFHTLEIFLLVEVLFRFRLKLYKIGY
jgi:hypothetical protein